MAGVYSVSQVNAYIKNMFAQDFALNRISVKGEVSNCKYHTSGHIYFTLKDGLGAMQAVMFASRRKGLTFRLEEGQQVVVKGSIEVYERDGRYQLYASEITLDGTGDLFRRFEKLRNELEEMGMFDSCYKRPIPRVCKNGRYRDGEHRRSNPGYYQYLGTAEPLRAACPLPGTGAGSRGSAEYRAGDPDPGCAASGCADRRARRRFD